MPADNLSVEQVIITALLVTITSMSRVQLPWLTTATHHTLRSLDKEVREGYKSMGERVLNLGLCSLATSVRGGIAKGLPVGLSPVIESCLSSEEVIFHLLRKADKKRATHIASGSVGSKQVGNVHNGFLLYMGGLWSEDEDLTKVFEWINRVFRPLVQVAVDTYEKFHNPATPPQAPERVECPEPESSNRPVKRPRNALPADVRALNQIYAIQLSQQPPKVSADTRAKFFDLAVSFCSSPLRMDTRGNLNHKDDRDRSLHGLSQVATREYPPDSTGSGTFAELRKHSSSPLQTPFTLKRKRQISWDPPVAHSPLSPSPTFASFVTPSSLSSPDASPVQYASYYSPAISPVQASASPNLSPVFSPLPDDNPTPIFSPFSFSPSTQRSVTSPNLYLARHENGSESEDSPPLRLFSAGFSSTSSTPSFK
ncbi:hypothetical protein R3P38DRAFT_3249267 [Favolaschia claudopus]|uniref:Uncharacterized protein n=1 Tax=Favolaschia claudopus TaxID=2862362 RepID=A0AAW0EHK2_9AGAR